MYLSIQVQTKKEETLPPSHSQNIPTFYFPRGYPKEKVNIDAVIAKIEKIFSEFPNERATLEDMGKVAKVRTFWPSSFCMVLLWKGKMSSLCSVFLYCIVCFHFPHVSIQR